MPDAPGDYAAVVRAVSVLSVEWHLEPLRSHAASTGPSDELRDMTRRFWLGLLLAFPVLILEMGSHLFPAFENTVSPQYNTWLQLSLWPLLS